jgi:nitric oxide reductase subunit B
MLGLGLMVFCVRSLMPGRPWKTGAIAFSSWAINIGLLLTVTVSLLPVGLMQTWATTTHGTWYARGPAFLRTPTVQTLRWLRVPCDTIFAIGVLAMGWFKVGLLTGHSFRKEEGREVLAGQVTEAREPVTVP